MDIQKEIKTSEETTSEFFKKQIIEMLDDADEKAQRCIYFFVKSYLGYVNSLPQRKTATNKK